MLQDYYSELKPTLPNFLFLWRYGSVVGPVPSTMFRAGSERQSKDSDIVNQAGEKRRRV